MFWEDFSLSDFLELILILGSLIAAYWKLSARLTIVEEKTSHLENEVHTNEGKLEKKLDALTAKIDALIVEVTKLKARQQ